MLSPNQIAIYLGPSLSADDARTILDADYRPPVRRGDIDQLMKQPERPKIVGIIDGTFFQSFAISPKEMLPALEQGVTMLGSSSMGALRAVELAPYGMIGVGRVFEMYMTGEVDADDEVAIVFEAETGRAHSVPMVNVRVVLDAARKDGIITAKEEQALVRIVKEEYFPHRTYPMMFRLAEGAGAISTETRSRLEHFLKNGAPDAKRDDGIRLLHEVKRIAASL
jgi:TfuA protein